MKAIGKAAFLCSLAAILSTPIANASEQARLSAYFRQKIEQVQTANLALPTSGPENSGGILLQDFNVDFTAQASFGISDVLKLTLATELDFVFAPEESASSAAN